MRVMINHYKVTLDADGMQLSCLCTGCGNREPVVCFCHGDIETIVCNECGNLYQMRNKRYERVTCLS